MNTKTDARIIYAGYTELVDAARRLRDQGDITHDQFDDILRRYALLKNTGEV